MNTNESSDTVNVTPLTVRTDDELVQPILINAESTHENAVYAAARAAAEAWMNTRHDPAHAADWAAWLNAAYPKTVRRIKPNRVEKLPTPDATVTHLDSTAYAYAPARYPDFPAEIARAQVSGTDFPRTAWTPLFSATAPVLLVLNPSVDYMSTGKTAAQAAHALIAYMSSLPDDAVTVPDFQIVIADDEDTFNTFAYSNPFTITDHGRTEIDANTQTFTVIAL